MKRRRDVPVIMLHTAYLPLKMPFWTDEIKTSSLLMAAIRAAANSELISQNDASKFDEQPVIILINKSTYNLADMSKYHGIALKCRIEECRQGKSGGYILKFFAKSRVEVVSFTQTDPYLRAIANYIPEYGANTSSSRQLIKDIKEIFDKFIKFGRMKEGLYDLLANIKEPGVFADAALYYLGRTIFEEKDLRALFDVLNIDKRLAAFYDKLSNKLVEIEEETIVQNKVLEEQRKQHREYVLRKQMGIVLEELKKEGGNKDEGEGGDDADIIEIFKKRIEDAKMPPETENVAKKELQRLSIMRRDMQEAEVSRKFLDDLCSYPWSISTADNFNLDNARRILDEDHYGLEQVKKRVLEFLAVRKINPKKKGSVICFDGPPGTGKTSVAKSVARALGRKFVRISLGGIDDEAKIRGHRRTYVGAFPGCIAKAMISAGANNPVIDLDEIDKIRSSMRGDPSGALLEVLDPEVNNAFSDHYFGPGAEVDLSQVIFICTSNYKYNILPTLRDRLEIIDFAGYIDEEKVQIAKRHLIPKQITENGLEGRGIEFSDGSLRAIINQYAQEAGVRTLEREIATALRSRAIAIASNKLFAATITKEELPEILGVPRYEEDKTVNADIPGIVTGLAVTAYGGTTIVIEIAQMKKLHETGILKITGRLAQVMTESAMVAYTCAKNYLKNEMNIDVPDMDRHIHCDEGNVPKDGPSAGCAMTLAFISLISGRKVRSDLALTGEIDLLGRSMVVGGIKAKILAAHRAGYTHVFIPARNKKDLSEIPEEVKKELNIMLAKKIGDIVEFALV